MGHFENVFPGCVFPGLLVANARQIRSLYPTLRYDHRPVDTAEAHYDAKMTEEFRVGYACFKFAVAKVLQPGRIVEIGVGSGIAARAFLEACPTAGYHGIDDGGMGYLDMVRQKLAPFRAEITVADSGQVETLPECDLVHVDGDHCFDYAYGDTLKALRAARWVLVDDARDSQVAAGAMKALYDSRPGSCEWAYFEDTWTGSLLFWRDTVRP